ncbi:hypothetical protein D9V41_15190 [Aeromicrobium phragmitis]|uniref:SRPBCC family protein n=2 Tax=Aeromicrobium phragmitis TaxID=2478914 RepID=A0A3L8PJF3_9ACTN|nr:hypothetical protein D9V41_15190 [Aeromicrobium phragmitis]
MTTEPALDAVAVATTVAVLASYVGVGGVGAWSGGLLLGVTAGIAARLGVRQVAVDRGLAPLRPAGDRLRGRIYVETRIRAPLDRVWALTQEPEQHARWDLRFGRIEPVGSDAGALRFSYSTLGVAGQGVHVGDRWRQSGGATSSLRFASSHRLSPIAEGAGYWRYEPSGEGLRFLTGYDYRPRYPHIDLVFRPLMAWATAWSFDRLRLWAERHQRPGRSLVVAFADFGVRCATVAVAGVAGDGLTAAAAAILMRWVPVLPCVPSASRCLRHPPDARSGTAPQALATLEDA